MGSKIGAMKIAAAAVGISLDEYLALINNGKKRCRKCKTWKDTSSFCKDRSRGDGYATVCVECKNTRKTTGPGAKERAQKLKQGVKWCRKCGKWLPKEDVRNGVCQPHANEYDRERYRNDANYRNERRQHAHSRKRGTDPVPAIGIEYKLDMFDGKCTYCNNNAETMDHVVPISKGGKTTPHNIVPACAPCNASKGNRDVWEWIEKTKKNVDLRCP